MSCSVGTVGHFALVEKHKEKDIIYNFRNYGDKDIFTILKKHRDQDIINNFRKA